MAIRILALCAVLLLPVTMCQAALYNGGFEEGSSGWKWVAKPNGATGANQYWNLQNQSGVIVPHNPLEEHEGDQFGMLEPDGGSNAFAALYRAGVTDLGGWRLQGVYAFNKVWASDYLRLAVVEDSVWQSKLVWNPGAGENEYTGNIQIGDCVWYQDVTLDTCDDPDTFTDDWWQSFDTGWLAGGTYTVLFQANRVGVPLGGGYSMAGIDSLTHTPEPSLGLLLLVGMIPVAIGFRRRRRA